MLDDTTRLQSAHLFRERHDYQVCTRCVMDTSDPEITFDDDGICNHCHTYDEYMKKYVVGGEPGRQKLAALVETIKKEGQGKRYDCIIGLSGGVDSSFVAHQVKQYGLRPLAVHMDNGWNSETAVRNIESIVRKLDIDLHTLVLDWEEFRSLQLAFLRASTPDSEIPTDHAIVSAMFRLAAREHVRFIVEGSNYVTESMVPRTWSHGHSDWRYIASINKRFGGKRLRTYPHYNYFEHLVWFPRVKKIRRVPILDYLDYNKLEAIETLKKELDWQPYGAKHYESIYTRLFQGHILPEKFGFDKRRPHLSCLVNNGLMTREQAASQLHEPAIRKDQLVEDRSFAVKKLGLTERELDDIMALPKRTFWDYRSYERSPPLWLKMVRFARRVRFALGKIKRAILMQEPA